MRTSSRPNPFGFRFFGGLLVLLLGICTVFALSLSSEPDLDLSFERSIPSKASNERLDRELAQLSHWPDWFFSLDHAKYVNPSSTRLRAGELVELFVDPKRGMSKRFQLVVEVKQYEPGKLIDLELKQDSSGRLTRLFSHLEWVIRLEGESRNLLIRGTGLARTRHWKSRLFGRLTRKIIMNQVFYPNLIKLSETGQDHDDGHVAFTPE